ncbi:MAG: dTDP-glucose 4,6-dehydratase [Nitrospirae bacterium]|nr:dTDP-glucose 4,6-dehydratase [Nitrospirota bacterium]
MKKILVTGGCGFIGSNFVRMVLRETDLRVVNLDALTYAGNLANLADVASSPRYSFVQGRIEDEAAVSAAMAGVDAVVHFAAESHVDRSIQDSRPFVITNVVGTQTMLDAARRAGVGKFVHISTDEVYGTLGDSGIFTEETPLAPNSPYSASKAGADLLVRSYFETHGMPVATVRPSNNYGPYQFPEKFIPLMVTNLSDGGRIPVYGDGRNIRDWLFVEDNCRAILAVLERAAPGSVYNVGGESEVRNIEVAHKVLALMGRDDSRIDFVTDRLGHDFRYALDNSKIRRELGWKPSVSFDEGIERTVGWYRDNRAWWERLKG